MQMSIIHRYPALLSVILLLIAAGPAAATAASHGSMPRPVGTVLTQPTRLGRIVVVGNRLPLPIALEVLKTALRSPWDTSWKDRNQIVCRFTQPLGSHIKDREGLYCETNNDFFQRLYALHTGLESGGPIAVVESSDQPETVDVDPARLRKLLAKVPPAGSTYTLEVTSHGQVVSEWFMKKGQLVKVWHRNLKVKH